MWSNIFWKSALERAAKTFAQTLVALITADGIGLVQAPWTAWLSAAALAAVASLLSSVGSTAVGDPGSASMVVAERPLV